MLSAILHFSISLSGISQDVPKHKHMDENDSSIHANMAGKKHFSKKKNARIKSTERDTVAAMHDPMGAIDGAVNGSIAKNGGDTMNAIMHMDTVKGGNRKSHDMHMEMSSHDDLMQHEGMKMEMMNSPFSLHLPMQRHGSGTGWLPDASPMYGNMLHSPKWMYMLHGNLFIRYNNQDIFNNGTRGGRKVDAPNWIMFMAQAKAGRNGVFHFSSMLSLDPLTMGGSGYPLLFQSGEAYQGKALVDRQHPHDLFSELSISYSYALTKKSDIFFYIGYPGEPALGPVAFMHRPSSLYNPDAPLSHHWSDATHITFGVTTVGVRLGNVKVDGSLFTGKEPDDNRYDFDKPKFDSRSVRLSYNPSEHWALQVSHGFIKSPEQLHADEDVHRTTASVVYSRPLKSDGWLNISSVFGSNRTKDHKSENSVLAELSWKMKKSAVYTRYEFVEKSAEELSLDPSFYQDDKIFPVNAFTLGTSRDLFKAGKIRLAAGAQLSYYAVDKKLSGLYGKNPVSLEAYIRIYPGLMM